MNSIGHYFRFTSFGESHGPMVGGVLDGCPAGLVLDIDKINYELQRRRPGQSSLTTQRCESDKVEFVSGLFEEKTTGAPIAFFIRNENQRSQDYDCMRELFRPSHADYTYQMKYGVRDHRGGGRSSARETATRVVAGAIAKQWLEKWGITIHAYTSQVGPIALEQDYTQYNLDLTESNPVRCPHPALALQMQHLIEKVRQEGDSIGGTITCLVKKVPAGLGEPIFDKLQSHLASAMMSINACKGFEYGSGFSGVTLKGSEMYLSDNQQLISGGIAGGISDGSPITFRCVFKPTASNRKTLEVLHSTLNSQLSTLKKGRHDVFPFLLIPCQILLLYP